MDPIDAIVRNASAMVYMGLKNVAENRAINEAVALGLGEKVEKGSTSGREVVVLVEGEERTYRIDDALLHDVLVGAFDGNNPSDQVTTWINRAGAPARWLREAVTRTPEFAIANMLRDSLSVWAQGGGHRVPVYPALKTFGSNLLRMRRGEPSDWWLRVGRC